MTASEDPDRNADFRPGSKGDMTAPKSDFRYTPESELKSDIAACPFGADSVAKVQKAQCLISRQRTKQATIADQ